MIILFLVICLISFLISIPFTIFGCTGAVIFWIFTILLAKELFYFDGEKYRKWFHWFVGIYACLGSVLFSSLYVIGVYRDTLNIGVWFLLSLIILTPLGALASYLIHDKFKISLTRKTKTQTDKIPTNVASDKCNSIYKKAWIVQVCLCGCIIAYCLVDYLNPDAIRKLDKEIGSIIEMVSIIIYVASIIGFALIAVYGKRTKFLVIVGPLILHVLVHVLGANNLTDIASVTQRILGCLKDVDLWAPMVLLSLFLYIIFRFAYDRKIKKNS